MASITKNIFQFFYYLVIIIIIILVLYKFFFVAYPRLFFTGHTESGFESWLDDFSSKFLTYILDLKDSKILVEKIDKFLNKYKEHFNVQINRESLNKDVKFEDIRFTPLIMMFIFFHDLKQGIDTHIKNCYNIFQDSSPPVLKLIKTFYNPKTKAPSEFIALQKFKDICDVFLQLREAIGEEAKGKLAKVETLSKDDKFQDIDVKVLVLDIMLNIYLSPGGKYLDKLTFSEKCANIERMSRTRMTGKGTGENWTLVKLYTEEYQYYIIYEKIVPMWKRYPADAKRWMNIVQDAITSPSISRWISQLPSRFAGGGFTNDEVVEHFGLDKIIVAFISIGTVFSSLVNVITNPLSFIKFLIGVIFSITLQIVYIFVVLIGANIIAPCFGYVSRVFFNVGLTIFMIIILLLYYVIYIVLALIDTVTGGIIMKALRCENLPDAWAKLPNFSKSNKYTRTFLCSVPCAKRYEPNGFLCVKKPKEIPTFSPQQIIYQTWENKQYFNNLKEQILYEKTPDQSYFLDLTPDEQKGMWGDVYKQSVDYYGETMDEYSKFDPIIRGMCTCMVSEETSQLSQEGKEKLKELCQYTYCTSEQPNLKNLPFCTNFTLDEKKNETSSEKKNIIKLILYILAAITFTFTIVILMMYYKNSFFLESVTDLGIELYQTLPKPKPPNDFFTNAKSLVNKAKAKTKDVVSKAKNAIGNKTKEVLTKTKEVITKTKDVVENGKDIKS